MYSSAQGPSYHSLPWVVRGGGIFFIFIGLRIVLIITVVIVIVRWSYDLNVVVRVGDLSIVYWWSLLGGIMGVSGRVQKCNCKCKTNNLEIAITKKLIFNQQHSSYDMIDFARDIFICLCRCIRVYILTHSLCFFSARLITFPWKWWLIKLVFLFVFVFVFVF